LFLGCYGCACVRCACMRKLWVKNNFVYPFEAFLTPGGCPGFMYHELRVLGLYVRSHTAIAPCVYAHTQSGSAPVAVGGAAPGRRRGAAPGRHLRPRSHRSCRLAAGPPQRPVRSGLCMVIERRGSFCGPPRGLPRGGGLPAGCTTWHGSY
jgi:hypothetical protein